MIPMMPMASPTSVERIARPMLAKVGIMFAGVPPGVLVRSAINASAVGHRGQRTHATFLRTSPGPGTKVPSSEYWLSLLRSVRMEMPRMLAAWVRLPST